MPQPRSTKNINSDDDIDYSDLLGDDLPTPARPREQISQRLQQRPVSVPPAPRTPQQSPVPRVTGVSNVSRPGASTGTGTGVVPGSRQPNSRPYSNRPATSGRGVQPSRTEQVVAPSEPKTDTSKKIAEEIAKTIAETEKKHDTERRRASGTRLPASQVAMGGRPNTSRQNTVHVPVELFNLVRAEFPGARSQDVAMAAYIARHSNAESLVTKPEVLEALSQAAESNDVYESIRGELESLRATLRGLRRETSISSMASALVLQEWYRFQNREMRIEDWIRLSDPLMAVMNELTSVSREYSDEVRHAAGRIQQGYGS